MNTWLKKRNQSVIKLQHGALDATTEGPDPEQLALNDTITGVPMNNHLSPPVLEERAAQTHTEHGNAVAISTLTGSNSPPRNTGAKRPRPLTSAITKALPAATYGNTLKHQPSVLQQHKISMKFATLNVRGIRTSKLWVEAALAEHKADIVFLTEHKLKPQATSNKGLLAALGKIGYQAQLSCSQPSDGEVFGSSRKTIARARKARRPDRKT